MNKLLVFAAIIPLSVGVTNAAETVIKGPNGLSINCADFQKLPNGGWHSGPTATLSYPDRQGSFAENTFGEHGINIAGVDLAVFLNQTCPK